MDFSSQQADPRRHLVGFTFVILFHAFVVYALVTGLAKKVVDVVRAPIDTKVIEEVKKPPPPEEVAPPPPKLEAPPPPYIPPPEVQVATPPTEATITAVPSPKPTAPVAIATVGPPPAPAPAAALGILGSIDMNRGDHQLGWDTDQFPNNVPETALALYHILQAGGLGTGGLNFDAKLRRQSIDAEDLFHGHIGGMDVCARALLMAEQMILDARLDQAVQARYAGWSTPAAQDILAGRVPLDALADQVLAKNTDPQPVSGRQEVLENLVNRFCA
jgi:hypothetical protein